MQGQQVQSAQHQIAGGNVILKMNDIQQLSGGGKNMRFILNCVLF